MKLLSLKAAKLYFTESGGLGGNYSLDVTSFDVSIGDRIFVVGRSGQGKTTLLRALAGLHPLSSGMLQRFPQSIRIGMLPQQPEIIPWRTIGSNLKLPSEIAGQPAVPRGFERLLSALGLSNIEHKLPHQLSVGMRTRVALIQIVLSRPKLLLLDEPTAALDDLSSRLLMQFVRDYILEAEAGAVIVTHDKGLVSEWASDVYQLSGNRTIKVTRETPSNPTRECEGEL